MNQLTLEEAMKIRRSIVKPRKFGYITIGDQRVMCSTTPHVSDEDFKWLKENHPYETDLIIGYVLDLEYKLKNYNREQWQGMMDRDPEKERRIKVGRTKLLRSVNHNYQPFDVTYGGHKEFKELVNTTFGDVEWYVSCFMITYHPDRWYRPVWERVREVTERW